METTYKNSVYTPLKNVSNNAQGAYDAGYRWCYSFEVPAGYNTGVSVTRGNLARNTYWPKYSGNSNNDIIVVPSGDKFPACDSSYTSIVEALKSIGVDSSFSYRAKIAAANGISNYTGTASQNTQMLNLLKQGKLVSPDNSSNNNVPNPPAEVDYGTVGYYPKCSSSFTSIVDALKSIGVDSSMTNRKKIAAANGISNYSGTADQNTTMLNLLKSGKLKNPNGVSTDSGKYYPACSSSYTSLVDALKSVGVDSSYSYREKIAAQNGISGYSGSASQNSQLLNLLKSGKLIKVGYVEIVNYTITLNANGGSCSTASITVASNSTYKGLINPSREGYTFNGWFTAASGGTQVKDGSALVSKSNHTLYAHWTTNTYTVSYNKNDGSYTIYRYNKRNSVSPPPSVVDPTPNPNGYWKYTYYPACGSSYTSIVDALNSIGVDSSYSNRQSIAELNGISNYTGSAAQNTQMLDLLKSGKLIKSKTWVPATTKATTTTTKKTTTTTKATTTTTKKTTTTTKATTTTTPPSSNGYWLIEYYPKPSGVITIPENDSLVAYLSAIGEDTSFENRKKIAEMNDISNYTGTASQNSQMLSLLKQGKLIKFKAWVVNGTTSTTKRSTTTTTATTTTTTTATTIPLVVEEVNITLENGEQYLIKANQENLTFISNDTDIAIVSKNGLITALDEGTAIISVINSNYDVVQIKVNVVAVSVTGDADGNGKVDQDDLILLNNHYSQLKERWHNFNPFAKWRTPLNLASCFLPLASVCDLGGA